MSNVTQLFPLRKHLDKAKKILREAEPRVASGESNNTLEAVLLQIEEIKALLKKMKHRLFYRNKLALHTSLQLKA